MHALTLHGCHAWAVAHAGKWIENRGWDPPMKHIGTRIAIHAGLKPGDPEAQRMLRRRRGAPESWPRGVIVATALLKGVVVGNKFVGVMRVVGPIADDEAVRAIGSKWWIGPCGWILTEVEPLTPHIACKGALGLWVVPAQISQSCEAVDVFSDHGRDASRPGRSRGSHRGGK